MKVHLISTPDVHPQLVTEVLEILNSVNGPLEFSNLRMSWNPNDLAMVNQHRFRHDFHFTIDSEYQKQKYDAQRGYPLSWRELFSMCNIARQTVDLEDEDFVVVLTNRRNSMNFFSMFDTRGLRNAFVQCSDWDLFLKAPEYLPVAYEIVADVMRILMNFQLTQEHLDKFHTEPLGCMNDLCQNKKDIILKMRTADLCPSCLARLEECEVSESVTVQALQIFETVRNSLKFSQGFLGQLKPKPLKITHNGEVSVGDTVLTLGPLQKAIFIFFLKHPQGVRISELEDYEQELFKIYQKIKPNADQATIRNLVNIIDGNFNYNKSRLTKALKEQIGEPLANFYYISGVPGEKFSVALPENLIDIHRDFRVNVV